SLSDLFLLALAGEEARRLVRGYREQHAAAQQAWRKGDRRRAMHLVGIRSAGHGQRFYPEHLEAYIRLRGGGKSPAAAANVVCQQFELKRASFSEWLRKQRTRIRGRLAALEEMIARESASERERAHADLHSLRVQSAIDEELFARESRNADVAARM